MSLKEKLAEDLKSSMKNKDTVRKNTVQLVCTAILQVESNARTLFLNMKRVAERI